MKRRGLRRRVAVLFDAIEDDYQEEILRGILAEAEHAHVDLLLLAGGVVGDPSMPGKHARNFLFDLFEAERVDGLILLSGALGNELGPARFAHWVERFVDKPIVHVGIEVPGQDSIVVDGGAAMYQLVRHLITEHDKRRVAFIRGPQTSHEAEERYAAYQRALADSGIEFDERLVVQGTWLRESGVQAVHELMDTRRIGLRGSALVAANDYMALGALEALRARGMSVPHDVVLTGFDDIAVTRTAVPPLTTIRQPTARLGQESLRRLAATMNRSEPAETQHLPAEPMLRASCGCRGGASALVPRHRHGAHSSLRAELLQRKPLIQAELSRAARATLQGVGSGWEERMVDALLSDLAQQSSAATTGALERMIGKLPGIGSELSAFHAVIDVLRQAVRTAAGSDSDAAAQAADILDDARKLVGDSVTRAQLFRGSQTLKKLHEITQITAALLGATPLAQQRKNTEKRLRELGIDALSLGVFAHPGVVDDECVSLAAYNGDHPSAPGAPFHSRSFAPAGLFDDGIPALLVQPLVVDQEPVGLVALSWGPWEGMAYEQIREVLSVGLKAVQLLHPELARAV